MQFVYHNPTKVYFGQSLISSIGKEISRYGFKKVMLLAGSGSIKQNGVYNQLVSSLEKYEIEFVECWGVVPNPILSHTQNAIELARKENIEAIIAAGGGSVIDEAKSIAAGFYLDNIWNVYERKASIEDALPIFTVLTLSGTGSEMNSIAVLTNEIDKKKWNIGSPLLYPIATFIDPTIQFSLPWHQTVNGGIDAICHVLEYYFSGKEQEITISICESIIKTIILALDKLQNEPDNYEARSNLAWAATLALNGTSGVSLIGEWSSHRIEHGISALYPEVAHGAGLAIVFPAWIEYTKHTNPLQYERFAKNIWGKDTIEDAIIAMKNKFNEWGSPTSLSEIKISEIAIEDIANNASKLGVVGELLPLTAKEMKEILRIAY